MDVNVLKKKTKKTRSRRIEKKDDLEVTFTKRREALFRKASELSLLTGAEIAILIRSPEDKILSFGSPSVDALIDRFEAGGESASCSSDRQIVKQLEGRTKYEEAKTQEGQMWWDKPIDSMDLKELEQYAQDLEKLAADLGSDD